MNKIVAGLKDAIRFAKGEPVNARVTVYTQAHRNDVLEEAAQAAIDTAERFERIACTDDVADKMQDIGQGARHAAAEIRALKWQSFS